MKSSFIEINYIKYNKHRRTGASRFPVQPTCLFFTTIAYPFWLMDTESTGNKKNDMVRIGLQ